MATNNLSFFFKNKVEALINIYKKYKISVIIGLINTFDKISINAQKIIFLAVDGVHINCPVSSAY